MSTTTYEKVLILGFFMYIGAFMIGMGVGITDENRGVEDWFGIFNKALGIGCAIMFLMLPIMAYRLSKDRIPEFYAWLKVKRDEYKNKRADRSPREIANDVRFNKIMGAFLIIMAITMFVYSWCYGLEDYTVCDETLMLHVMNVGSLLTLETVLMLIVLGFVLEPNPERKDCIPEKDRKKAKVCLYLASFLSALINEICLYAFALITLYLFDGMEIDSNNLACLFMAMWVYAFMWFSLVLLPMLKFVIKRFSITEPEINDPTLAFGQYLFDKEKE